MKRFSLTTLSILISIIGLTPEGAMAEIDGLLNVESTNPSILRVTPTDSAGVMKVEFVGPGQAFLNVSADLKFIDGSIHPVNQQFGFDIFDPSQEPDHFGLQILGIEHADAPGAVRPTDLAGHALADTETSSADNATGAA